MVAPFIPGPGSRRGGPGRVLPIGAVLLAQVVALAVYAVLRVAGVAVVASVSAAVVVGALGAALCVNGSSGVSALGLMGRRLRFSRRRRRQPVDSPVPFDVPGSQGQPIGLRWDGDRIIAVVRISRPVQPRVQTPTQPVVAGSRLDLGTIARALTQFDIELESIDVVAHGWRTRAAGHITAPYQTLTQALPGVAHQDVWAVLRLDPLRCPDAIASRGGGPTGVIRTAITAARRVANHLAREGYVTTILSAHGITAMGDELLDGASLDTADENWTDLRLGRYTTRTYGLTEPLDARIQTAMWAPNCLSATTSTTVRRADDDGAFAICTVIRFNTLSDLAVTAPSGLIPLDGRHALGVEWSMPARRRPVPGLPVEVRTLDELSSLRLVDGSAGQLLGADPTGQAVSVPLFGQDVRRVDVYGQLYLALQITARAVATGARVVVRTDRPDAWRALSDSVGDHLTLFVTRTASEQRYPPNNFTVCILDSREAIEDPTIATQMRLHRGPGDVTPLDSSCDVAIYHDRHDPMRAYVVTGSGVLAVSLVSVPAENLIIEGSRQMRPAPSPVPSRGRDVEASENRGGRAPFAQDVRPGPGGQWPDGPGPGGPGPGGPGGSSGPGGPGGSGPGGEHPAGRAQPDGRRRLPDGEWRRGPQAPQRPADDRMAPPPVPEDPTPSGRHGLPPSDGPGRHSAD